MGRAEQTEAMRHADKPGAGVCKRRKLGASDRASAIMREFHRGTLRSGSGGKVKSEEQAKAIAASEARRARGGGKR